MSTSRCATLLTSALLLLCTAALAQQNTSTPQGDLLRAQGELLQGEGDFLRGAAWYELNTAKARSVDAKTAKAVYEWNRQVYDDYRQDRAERLGYRKNLTKARQAQAKRELEEKEYRLRTSPTIDDLVRGDALNALLIDLFDPTITDSQWRAAQVALPEGLTIRSLVFQFVPRVKHGAGQRTNAGLLAMGRLDAEGRWPVYLPENKLAKERKSYEQAYHVIRDECLRGKLSIESVSKLDEAIDALKARAATEIPTQRDYRAYAARFVEDMRSSARIFDAGSVALAQEMIADMQGGRDAQTVGELLAFMRKYRLLFASAENRPEDTDNYRQLYGLLRQQKEALGLITKPPAPASAASADAATAAPAARAADPLRPGAVWEGTREYPARGRRKETSRDRLIITDRQGSRFVGEITHNGAGFAGNGPNKVEGTIEGSKITFLETNPLQPSLQFHYTGQISRNTFTYTVEGNGTRGVRRAGQGQMTLTTR